MARKAKKTAKKSGKFDFDLSPHIHLQDKAAWERVRKIKREDIEKHSNPKFKIRVIPDADIEWIWVSDMFHQICRAAEENRNCVLILPNPAHSYRQLARLINKFQVNCRHLHVFAMDEYADQDGNTAPESWPKGFMHSLKKFLYFEIDRKLRPPEKQIHAPQTRIIKDYGKMMADAGGVDACYSGSGWAGHVAFVDPCPEFETDSAAEFLTMGARIVTLSPFTIAQNSLHGFFGMSGDMSQVPPKAATIGPAEVKAAKYRMDMNALTTLGTFSSWQRMTTRMVAHGPVTPKMPASVLQLMQCDFYITETAAADVEPHWDKGY